MSASNGMTCNGDGNGVIADGATVKGAVEMHLFWQHLSLAGFSAGSFTGTCAYAGDTCSGSNGYTYAANVNVLRAAYGAGLIIIFNTDAEIATYGNGTGIPPNSFYQEHGHHVYQIGGITGTDGVGNRVWNLAPAPAFTVQEAFLLDTKYDDGNPSSGGIHDGSPAGIAMQPGTGDNGCENTTVSPPSYDITTHKNALKCVLMIQSAF
jgi:hypothetical protein